MGIRDCFSGRSGRRGVCTGRLLQQCKQTPRGFGPSILHTASSLPWNRTRYCVRNSCRTPSEELRARVSTLDFIPASRILTISRKGAEGGEWRQDTFGHRQGIVGCIPSSQVCSGVYQRTRQSLRSKVMNPHHFPPTLTPPSNTKMSRRRSSNSSRC